MTASKPMIAVCNSFVGYYISMDVIVALMFDKRLGNCQIPERQAQSVKNAFPIYRFLSRSFHPLGFGIDLRTATKINIFEITQSLFDEKFFLQTL